MMIDLINCEACMRDVSFSHNVKSRFAALNTTGDYENKSTS